jgi:hypothetical protein
MNPEKKVEIALGKFAARHRYFRKLKGYTNYEHFAFR